MLLYAHDYLIRPDHVALYTHPAPAAPQVLPQSEPPQWTKNEDGSWSTAPFLFPADITIIVDGKVEKQIPQAAPKREPLTYEQLVSACYTYRHDFGLLDPDEQELVIEEAGRWAKAFGIGGSDAE